MSGVAQNAGMTDALDIIWIGQSVILGYRQVFDVCDEMMENLESGELVIS